MKTSAPPCRGCPARLLSYPIVSRHSRPSALAITDLRVARLAVPVIVQLDIHSNVSAEMIDHADGIIVRETYPEITEFARHP